MEISYDPSKEASNQAKHSISLTQAAALEWETALVWEDLRFDYGEVRHCALAISDQRLFCVTFTDRMNVRRIISLRKANKREFRRYVAYINTAH